MHVHVLTQSCPTLCDPMDCTLQASLSMGLSRQEYWSGLPLPPLGDLSDPGSLVSLALAGGLFTAPWATWKALYERKTCYFPSCHILTHCRAPGPSSGFFKFLWLPTLGLGIPPQHPQTLWFCSCSRCYLLLIYYCPHQWHKHPLCKVLVIQLQVISYLWLDWFGPCQVEMSLGRQYIWFAGQDLGTVVSKHITSCEISNEIVLWWFFNFYRTSSIRLENLCLLH